MKHKEKRLKKKKKWIDLSDLRHNAEKINQHAIRVPEGMREGQENNIWRNNDQNVSKLMKLIIPQMQEHLIRINTR